MAKPLNSSELPIHPIGHDISFLDSSSHHSGTRKRTRKSDTATCEETLISCDYPEDNHKTRRVNPHRLAARLAPELVAEMEAYIVPGAKMPNFTVRKDFQERYCVDRRHIYDYFHSRGLRVAKEDKHTNLTRGRISTAISHRPPREPTTEPTAKLDIREDSPPKAQNNSPLPTPPGILPARRVRHLVPAKTPAVKQRRCLGLSKKRVTGLSPSFSSPDISHSLADDEDSNYDAPGSPCPEFTLPEEYPDTPLLDEHSDISIFDPTSELRHLYEITNDLSIDSPLENCLLGHADPLASIEDRRLLTQDERNEFYNLINGSITKSGGIGECSGTYSAYMEEQSRCYFDRLAYNTTSGYTRLNNFRPVTEPLGGEINFQKWLSVPARQDSFKAAHSYGETHMTRIHDHHTWVSADLESGDDVDSLVRNYLGPAVTDIHDAHEHASNKNVLTSRPDPRFEPRPFQDQSIEEDLSRATASFTGNANTRTLQSRGFSGPHDRFTPVRPISYRIPSRSRTNSAGGGI